VTATTIRERPILFSAPMVRAILEDRKTQTRRVVKPQPQDGYKIFPWYHRFYAAPREDPRIVGFQFFDCPYGKAGDRLWVRETFVNNFGQLLYRADCHPDSFEYGAKGWKPSIFMPRKLSRTTLEIMSVSVQRVQDIDDDEALAEGIKTHPPARSHHRTTYSHFDSPHPAGLYPATPRDGFRALWDEINDKRAPWSSNPWVWAISFRRCVEAK
jgi:hypothetical protein